MSLESVPPCLHEYPVSVDFYNDARPPSAETSDAQSLAAAAILDNLEEAADTASAAGSVLSELYCPTGTPSQAEAVQAAMVELLKARQMLFAELAKTHAASSSYTEGQWVEWYELYPLSTDDMKQAMALWRAHFERTGMREATRDRMEDLRNENTRPSKAEARQKTRSSFRTWLLQTYGHVALAKAFVKYPAAKLELLVDDWASYKQTDEYLKQKARSCKSDDDRCALKLRLYSLRHNRRLASKGFGAPKWIAAYQSGALDADIAALTEEHGFGRIEKNGEICHLRPPTFEGFLDGRHAQG